MLKTPIGKLRFMGYFEGISLLILLFIAMPLKYGLDIPEAVRIVGSIHGALFVTYCVIIAYVQLKVRWNIIWSVIAVAVAFIPFGNFIYDRKLDQLEEKYS
ncbi:integral membrane protein [Bacillus ectoiniformans]|uniref:DUF3817 domain-containing protein n=1 Tax=Bacillus ectoiniformans TaxID=1494429 RepID=UPI00195934B3|nr:DUF3817 domain-containing protein [Bacillus ectoiniformans]MBM7647410.1 integral membrane protein [Bacillus ectoiniformans]